MVLVRLVFGVWRAILAGLGSRGGGAGVWATPRSSGDVAGDEGDFRIGAAQSGITTPTCLDVVLEESPTDLRFKEEDDDGGGDGKYEKLVWQVETTVEVLDEAGPAETQGLSGTMTGT